MEASLRVGIVTGEVPRDGGGLRLRGLLEGHGAGDLGVTTENSNCTAIATLAQTRQTYRLRFGYRGEKRRRVPQAQESESRSTLDIQNSSKPGCLVGAATRSMADMCCACPTRYPPARCQQGVLVVVARKTCAIVLTAPIDTRDWRDRRDRGKPYQRGHGHGTYQP